MELNHGLKGSSLIQRINYWSNRDQCAPLAALSLLLLSILGYLDLLPSWKTVRLAEQTLLKQVQRSTEMTINYLLLSVKPFDEDEDEDEDPNSMTAYSIQAPMSFTNLVKILLAESGCQIIILRRHDGADAQTDSHQPWRLHIRGNYQQISRFLSLSMQYAPVIELPSIDIEKKQHDIELSAIIYFINDNNRGDDESVS